MFYRKHDRVRTPVGTHSMTKQAHKAECDINNILSQYKRTGIITHVQSARASYDDLPSDLDFQQAMNTMMAADQAFEGLPAVVRDHFGNNPERFLAALSDPDQADKLREWGVLGARPEPAPIRPPSPSEPPSDPPK